MSTDEILTGLGLVIVVALGCELVASRTKIPAIVLLLPAGFVAGAATPDLRPAALVGATFTAVRAGAAGDKVFHPGELLLSVATGLIIGAIGAAALWLLLNGIQRAEPRNSVAAALMTVTAAVVAADLIREDSGFVAATTMGMILANQQQLDVSRVLEFQGTVVKLLIGILFVLISASVRPSTLHS